MATVDPNAQAIIKNWLANIGLGSLGDWAWQRYKETNSIDLVKLEMQDRPEYKQRFAGRLALQKKGIQMTEAEQVAWETQASQLMHQAGMPSSFYDSPSDFQSLIGGGVSVAELSTRINDAYAKVAHAPKEIRTALQDYYGVKSDAALAALALDAKKATPIIMQEVAAAEAGGYLAQQGFKIQRDVAERIATLTANDPNQIQQGSQALGKVASIFDPLQGENGPDLKTGVEAIFGGEQGAQRDVQRAIDQRQAETSGKGDFETSSKGVTGLGTGNRT